MLGLKLHGSANIYQVYLIFGCLSCGKDMIGKFVMLDAWIYTAQSQPKEIMKMQRAYFSWDIIMVIHHFSHFHLSTYSVFFLVFIYLLLGMS